MRIRQILVRVEPEAILGEYGEVHNCQIDVKFFGRETYHRREVIPDDDFTRRFDWMMDQVKNTVNAFMERDAS